jgi:hypothetical protein
MPLHERNHKGLEMVLSSLFGAFATWGGVIWQREGGGVAQVCRFGAILPHMWKPLPIVVLLCLLAGPVVAKQLSFSAKAEGNAVRFSTRWIDVENREQALTFAIPQDDLRRGKDEFRPFDNDEASKRAFTEVQAYAHRASVGGRVIKVTQNYKGYDVQAQTQAATQAEADARNREIMDELQKVRDKAVADYMADNFYTRVDDTHVMPDHKRIARRYASALTPLAVATRQNLLAQGRGTDPRSAAGYLLGYFQTIPYDTLLSRLSSNGTGFKTPYGLISGNKGDCDTKSVAMAAVLRQLYPTLRLTMVYVPDHAFLGMEIPRGPKDYALKLGGSAFVLVDPTGPRLLRVGEVDRKALDDLEAGRYSYQEIPF